MKRFINVFKKMAVAGLILTSLTGLTGCNENETKSVGSGEPGVVAPVDWTGFDKVVAQIKSETDFDKRIDLMHQAEDMLMDTGAVCPICYKVVNYLQKKNISGVRITAGGAFDIRYIEETGDATTRVNICTEPTTLDYALGVTQDVGTIALNCSVGLLTYNQKNEIIPALADSYDLSDDKCTYTFKMKNDLKWSDGSPLSAKDFEYTWKRNAATETGSDFEYMFSYIEGYPDNLNVQASEDGNTLTVKLSSPCAYFTDLCTFSAYQPLKQSQIEAASGYKDSSGKVVNPGAWAQEGGVVSNGAYIVDTWKHNENIVLKKNPYYYDADNVKTDTVYMMLTADATAAYSAYASGDIDLVSKLPADDLRELKDSEEYNQTNAIGTTYFAYNIQSDVFAGMTAEEAASMRKALNMVVDRKFLIDIALMTGNEPATAFVCPGVLDGTGNEFRRNTTEYKYADNLGYFKVEPDLDKAREMLKEIGFEFNDDGKLKNQITIEYKTNAGSSNEAMAACIQADFAQLGINLSIKTDDWNVFVKERRQGQFEIARGAWNADYNDALGMLEIFTSDSPNNDPRLGK